MINRELETPDVWNDARNAQELGREKKMLEGVVERIGSIDAALGDVAELFAMASAESDHDTLVAVESDTHAIEAQVADLEFRRMFSNPADPNACFIEIQAGAGGTEAQDWAAMLLRLSLIHI